jgi:membrane-associated phospholipid phosphatase
VGVQLASSLPDEARWQGKNPVDDGVRHSWRFNSRSARDRGAAVSDWLFYSTMAYPIVVDSMLVTWLGLGNSDLAWETFVINAQALSVAAFVGRLGQRLAGRKRPLQVGCEEEGTGYHKFCPGTPESFISGHVAMSFTGATLICVNHHNLPIYGAPWADSLVCYAGLAAATATASLRINADMHWFSDVFLGTVLGVSSGYVFSAMAHYTTVSDGQVRAFVLPQLSQDSAGLQLVGAF